MPAVPVDLPLNAKAEIEPKRQIPQGKFETGSFRLPANCNALRAHVLRDNWPDIKDGNGKSLDVVSIVTWFSFDNGATWGNGTGSTHVGGVWTHRDGTIMNECLPTTYDIPDGPNRLVKVEVTPLRGPLSASVSITAAQIVRGANGGG